MKGFSFIRLITEDKIITPLKIRINKLDFIKISLNYILVFFI